MWEATGAVLAGGKSSRMGTDKALLILNNESLLERSVKKLKNAFDEVIIVRDASKEYNIPGAREITDIYRHIGPLAGIYTALERSSYNYVFITACDMPFWDQNIVELLMNSCNGYDAAVPRLKGLFQPLLAVYTKNCIKAIESCMARGMCKVSVLYDILKVNIVDSTLLEHISVPEKTFCNVNTPDDFRNLQILYKE